MERAKYIIIGLVVFFCISTANANYKSEIYHAYISNDMSKWEKVITEMHSKNSASDEFILEQINYEYGYIAWCIGNKHKKEAEKWLSIAENRLSSLEQKKKHASTANAYKSAFYGFKIGLNVAKAPILGFKSVNCAELAMKQDAQNALGYIQYGNAQYYMPAIFGGSKKVAIEYYLKAESLLATNKSALKEDWNYISLLTIIGKAYSETDNLKAAKNYYDKILRIEPNFRWVKDELYPKLLKKTE
jgi:tetratricopeptide (TPR) repeat protein